MQKLVQKISLKNFSSSISKTASWRSHCMISTNPTAQKVVLHRFSASAANYPLVLLKMKKIFTSSSVNISVAQHLKQLQQQLVRVVRHARRVKFPRSSDQQRSRLNDPWLAFLDRWRSSWRFPSADNILLGLVATNVAINLLWKSADPTFMRKNFMISVENLASGHVHTLVTSAFSHKEERHLFYNMLGLYVFGTSIGRTLGSRFMLKLYLAGAVGGSIFFILRHMFMGTPHSRNSGLYVDPKKVSGLGASGAVNAIMLLHIFLSPRAMYRLYLIIPVPGMILATFFIGQDIWRTVKKDGNISGEGHLGGAFVAALAWARIKKRWI